MEFRETLIAAQRNQQQKSSANSYYKAKFDPPKKEKEHKPKDKLSANIQKFLAKKEEEERQKQLETKRKRDELLAMRDPKAMRKIQKTLKVIKSANKSVLADAIDTENTAVTLEGPQQPDQDDYGYESQEAAALYQKMMEKYSKIPNEPKFPTSSSKSKKDIEGTKERVKYALQHADDPVPHKRRRKTNHEEDREPSPLPQPEQERKREEKPKFRKPMPPPMDFNQLLKLAEQKKSEPVEVAAPKKVMAENESVRPMTKKQKREYEEEMARKIRRQQEMERASGKKVNRDGKQTIQEREKKPDAANRIPKLSDRDPQNSIRGRIDNVKNIDRSENRDRSRMDKDGENNRGIERDRVDKHRGMNRERVDRESDRDRVDRGSDRDRAGRGSDRDRAGGGSDRDRGDRESDRDRGDRGSDRDRIDRGNNRDRGNDRDRIDRGNNRDRVDSGNHRDRIDRGNDRDRVDRGNNRDRIDRGCDQDRADKDRGRDKDREGDLYRDRGIDRTDRLHKERNAGVDRERPLDRERIINRDNPYNNKSEKQKLENFKFNRNSSQINSKNLDRTLLTQKFDTNREKLTNNLMKQDYKSNIDLKSQNTYRIDKNSNEKKMQGARPTLPNKSNDSKYVNGHSSQGRPVSKQLHPSADGRDKNVVTKQKILFGGNDSPRVNGTSKPDNRKIPQQDRNVPVKNRAEDRKPAGLPNSSKTQPSSSKPKVTNSFDFDKHVNALGKGKKPEGSRPLQTGDRKKQLPDPRGRMMQKKRVIDSEEDDSEMDDFIDDGDEDMDYSTHIKEIFGYDKSKYRHLDDDDDPDMESSFSRQMREEYISKKIGIMEDLEDMRMEAMEKKMKAKRKRRIDD